MRFANPAGLWWLMLAAPVILLHLLKPLRPLHVVSSTFLWQNFKRNITSVAPFKMLRFSWLLLLQLLIVALLALSIANPVRVFEAALAEHTVFLIDASGSMLALDGQPNRLADAQAKAIDLRKQLPTDGVASVIEVGTQPRVMLSASRDVDAFNEAVSATAATSGQGDFAAAFALAEGLETPDSPIGFVLISDGGLTDEERRLIPPGTTYEQVGSLNTNRAIVALEVDARPNDLAVEVTIANMGGHRTTQTLRLDVDGRTRERVELELAVGETQVHRTNLTSGSRVDAYLEGEDLLAADNRRTAVSRRRQQIKVGFEGKRDPFLEALFSSLSGVTVVNATLDETELNTETGNTGLEDNSADQIADIEPFDIVVYNDTEIPDDPSTAFLAFNPPSGIPGVSVTGQVDTPALTLVRSDDPLIQGIDLSALAVAKAQKVESEDAEVLLAAESAPLLLRGRANGVRFAYFTFSLSDSNLPLQLAFPLLGERILTSLGGAYLPPSSIEAGDTIVISPSAQRATANDINDIKVVDPAGATIDLPAWSSGVVVERLGIYRVISTDEPELLVAVNPASHESDITPVPSLPTEKRALRPGESPPNDLVSLRPWLLAALLMLITWEFLLSRKYTGVSSKQWKIAAAMRGLIVLALLGAFLNVGFNRRSGDVATVFVVDASDSMTVKGKKDAVRFVRDALADQPINSRAGVVLFGDDARIELLLQRQASLAAPSVKIDPSSSNLAVALRLGGAILPADARRRVVLISDGRATAGDVVEESAKLRERNIAVDTALIEPTDVGDIAILFVGTPNHVSVGDAVPINVLLESTFTGEAEVTVYADNKLVESRVISVEAGIQSVSFTDTATANGLRRYKVNVKSSQDRVVQNNTAFAAVDAGSLSQVLLVEGSRENTGADTGTSSNSDGTGERISSNSDLANALKAGGVDVQTVSTGEIPSLSGLLAYSSIILLDVDSRELSAQQVRALSGAVRDGGRGLLTIGGHQSYGLGGYYKSELESLLPVVSEILDPKRRQSVAEVLAIDTSGSMGACHCTEDEFQSNRFDGGVNKTDISRAAAARTIAALSENDEIGVLAFDVDERWVIDLQKLPAQDVVNQGLAGINPRGDTNPSGTLEAAAQALRASSASLKHIILFTDGFTSQELLEKLRNDAAALAEEGITVSVVATGEGAAAELGAVAEAGLGRFYPGRDIQRVPEIIMDEAVIASRDFITEVDFDELEKFKAGQPVASNGSSDFGFLPTITSTANVVADIESAPPLLGFIATTAKDRANILMRIGTADDPLLAQWRIGLGTATSWMSDASERWGQLWADWDGYVKFWSQVVRDTFPTLTDGTTAVVENGVLRIRVESDQGFADNAIASATITSPSLSRGEVNLKRVGADAFVGELPVDEAGVYVVGTSVTADDSDPMLGSALANQAYSREYKPGIPDTALMQRVAESGGGRSNVTPLQAFNPEGLVVGQTRVNFANYLVIAAAVAFIAAVFLSRFAVRALGNPVSVLNRKIFPKRLLTPIFKSPLSLFKSKAAASTESTAASAQNQTLQNVQALEPEQDQLNQGASYQDQDAPYQGQLDQDQLKQKVQDRQILEDLAEKEKAAKEKAKMRQPKQVETVSTLLEHARSKRQNRDN